MRYWLLLFILFTPFATADGPQETLNQYFAVLTSRDLQTLPELMDKQSMADLKILMDRAIRLQLANGNRELLERMLGKNAKPTQIKDTTSEQYLNQLATEILQAANLQRFFVDDRKMLGRVDETETMVHYVVRLTMSQQAKRSSDIHVYTLINEDGQWKLTFPPIIRQTLTLIETMLERY